MVWVDDRTLNEISADDEKMHDRILHQCDRFSFKNSVHADRFIGDRLQKVLAKFGIKLHIKSKAKAMDRLMREKNVKIEYRNKEHYPTIAEAHRRGIYIYKDDELVVFISRPNVIVKTTPTLVLLPGGKKQAEIDSIVVFSNADKFTGRFISSGKVKPISISILADGQRAG